MNISNHKGCIFCGEEETIVVNKGIPLNVCYACSVTVEDDFPEEQPPEGMRRATLEDQFYGGQLRNAIWQKWVPIEDPAGITVSNHTGAIDESKWTASNRTYER